MQLRMVREWVSGCQIILTVGAIVVLTAALHGQTCTGGPPDPGPNPSPEYLATYGKWLGPYMLKGPLFSGGACGSIVCQWHDPCYLDGLPANSIAHAILLP